MLRIVKRLRADDLPATLCSTCPGSLAASHPLQLLIKIINEPILLEQLKLLLSYLDMQ